MALVEFQSIGSIDLRGKGGLKELRLHKGRPSTGQKACNCLPVYSVLSLLKGHQRL